MNGTKQHPYLFAPLLLAVFFFSVFPFDFSRIAALRAQNQPAVDGFPHPECAYFTDFQQHSSQGLAALQRISVPEGFTRQSTPFGARTLAVAKALPAVSDGGPALDDSKSLSAIDFQIFSALEREGITPANHTNDAEFHRRVSLDLTGRIPSGESVVEFLQDTDPEKRSRLIDRLLDSPEWVDRWTMWFGDLLNNTARSTGVVRYNEGRNAFQRYIRVSLEEDKPYNQFASELITAAGDSFEQGAVNFTVGGRMPMGPNQDTFDKQWVQIATTFLGLKHFECLLCHDGAGHLEQVNLWASQVTREQAWGMAAFFSRTRLTRPVRERGTSYVVVDRSGGNYVLNTTDGNRPARLPTEGESRTVTPTYLFSGNQASSGENHRQALAREVTSDFQFARAAVNRLWAHFFTVGIVDPPDSFDPARQDPNNPPPEPWTIQPSHPELLDELARFFISTNYDLKDLMREICNSRAYQLSSRYEGEWRDAYEKFYARRLVRRLDSEELHDALAQSSGILGNFRVSGFSERIRWAMQLPDTVNPRRGVGEFLNTFLRGDRDENPRRGDLTVSQALGLMNDPVVIERVQASQRRGLLAQLLSSGGTDRELIEGLYLNVLSRYPTQDELLASAGILQSGDRQEKAEDLLWALYNKVDFIFNY